VYVLGKDVLHELVRGLAHQMTWSSLWTKYKVGMERRKGRGERTRQMQALRVIVNQTKTVGCPSRLDVH
jgi:hypothetical protein